MVDVSVELDPWVLKSQSCLDYHTMITQKQLKNPSLFSPFRNTKDWVECKATSPKGVIKLMPWIELFYGHPFRGEERHEVGAVYSRD